MSLRVLRCTRGAATVIDLRDCVDMAAVFGSRKVIATVSRWRRAALEVPQPALIDATASMPLRPRSGLRSRLGRRDFVAMSRGFAREGAVPQKAATATCRAVFVFL